MTMMKMIMVMMRSPHPSQDKPLRALCVSVRQELRAACRRALSPRAQAPVPPTQKPCHWNVLPMPCCGAANWRSHFVSSSAATSSGSPPSGEKAVAPASCQTSACARTRWRLVGCVGYILTNHRLRAVPHRVVDPPARGEGWVARRISVAVFVVADAEKPRGAVLQAWNDEGRDQGSDHAVQHGSAEPAVRKTSRQRLRAHGKGVVEDTQRFRADSDSSQADIGRCLRPRGYVSRCALRCGCRRMFRVAVSRIHTTRH